MMDAMKGPIIGATMETMAQTCWNHSGGENCFVSHSGRTPAMNHLETEDGGRTAKVFWTSR